MERKWKGGKNWVNEGKGRKRKEEKEYKKMQQKKKRKKLPTDWRRKENKGGKQE